MRYKDCAKILSKCLYYLFGILSIVLSPILFIDAMIIYLCETWLAGII